MCGICGIWDRHRGINEEDRRLVGRMADVMAHRGPDDAGTYADGRVAFGHRRLSVIDLSKNGHQPMSNEDGTVWITYNGEVYNFQELTKRFGLIEKGHRLKSSTDTEVIIHLYEELGPAMVEQLNGMFALAIWDANTQELHLFRDRYGIKPLFYSWQGDRFLFGSEIKSILQDPRVPRQVDRQSLHDFLTFDYIPGAQTAFEGIVELPPGHQLTIGSDGEVLMRRYWDLEFQVDDAIREGDAVAESLRLMEESVIRRLFADVPVGVMLSGGMDSSAIVALLARRNGNPVRTYSIGFDDASFNELPYARRVAHQFGTIHREVVVTPDMVRALLPKYLTYIDEPYADGSAIPTYYVSELAKDEVVVVLSGEGGDEAFAGYDTHAALKASKWFSHVPRWIRRGAIAPLVNQLPVSSKKLSLEFKLKRFLGGQDLPVQAAHLWWRIVLTEAQKLDLYSPAMRDAILESPQRHFDDVFQRSKATDDLNRILHIDSSVFLPDDLMIKNDRMTMAHSLEARVPFTDPELTSYLSRVPPQYKLTRLRKKHLMRSALRGILPDQILNKKKVGLEMPYSRWFRGELRDVLTDYCSRDRMEQTGLFRYEGVQQLLDEHMQRRADHGRALWGLLNFMMWHELYIA